MWRAFHPLKQLKMHTLAKLVLKSYMPDQLEVGMYFYTNVGKYLRIVQLDKVPLDEENYVRTNGYPVELYIVDEGNPNIANDTTIYALPHQIGWWDEGDHTDELRDIEVKDLNMIIEDYNGWVEIELDEEKSENVPVPILYEGKIVLREYNEFDDEEFEEEEEEEYEEDDDDEDILCGNCNGSGEGMWDGSRCFTCKGKGVIERDRYMFEGDDDWEPDYDSSGFTHEDNFNYEKDKEIPE